MANGSTVLRATLCTNSVSDWDIPLCLTHSSAMHYNAHLSLLLLSLHSGAYSLRVSPFWVEKGQKRKKKSPSTMSNSHFPYSLGACSCFPGSAVLLLYNNTFRECSHIHFLPFLLMSCRLLPKGFINRKSRPRTAFWLVSVWRTVSYRFYANE